MANLRVQINISVFRNDFQNLSNFQIHGIRHQIAQVFQNSDFGLIHEEENNKFSNQYATPEIDNVLEADPERILFGGSLTQHYSFSFPLSHGSLGLLVLHGFPTLETIIHDDYDCEVVLHLTMDAPDNRTY